MHDQLEEVFLRGREKQTLWSEEYKLNILDGVPRATACSMDYKGTFDVLNVTPFLNFAT